MIVIAKRLLLAALAMLMWLNAAGQSLTLEQAIDAALKNNLRVSAAEYQVKQYDQLKKASWDIGKTNATLMRGNFNSINTDNNLTITQTIPFPSVMVQQGKLGRARYEEARLSLVVSKNELAQQVRAAYLHLAYLKALSNLLHGQDSLYAEFARAAALRFETGESNLLEKTTAQTQLLEVRNQVRQNETDMLMYQTQLALLLNTDSLPDAADGLRKFALTDSLSYTNNPDVALAKQQITVNEFRTKVERNLFLPDITLGYFTQSLIGFQRVGSEDVFFDKNKRFDGFQVGISIPLWFPPQQGRASAAAMASQGAQLNADYVQNTVESNWQQARQELQKFEATLLYYNQDALQNATLIQRQAQLAFANGEIGYVEYLQAVRQAVSIQSNYLSTLNLYNQAASRLLFLAGQ